MIYMHLIYADRVLVDDKRQSCNNAISLTYRAAISYRLHRRILPAPTTIHNNQQQQPATSQRYGDKKRVGRRPYQYLKRDSLCNALAARCHHKLIGPCRQWWYVGLIKKPVHRLLCCGRCLGHGRTAAPLGHCHPHIGIQDWGAVRGGSHACGDVYRCMGLGCRWRRPNRHQALPYRGIVDLQCAAAMSRYYPRLNRPQKGRHKQQEIKKPLHG